MIETISFVLAFVVDALLQTWPYLLVTIPVAVAVNVSGVSRYIDRAFQARPLLAIVLATAVGAFSPFCSCSVIPVVASLLIGGVPLAPVMAFWIASPSMDPETFFLSVAMLDWDLALWRLGSTLVISLAAGFVTHVMVQYGWLGERMLRRGYRAEARGTGALLRGAWRNVVQRWRAQREPEPVVWLAAGVPLTTIAVRDTTPPEAEGVSCGLDGNCASAAPPSRRRRPSRRRLLQETWAATSLVLRFMVLAFVLEALIALYVPEAWIVGLLGRQNPAAIVLAAALGVPVYTSNLAALPMVGGLLEQGMSPAAALAFLVAGPTTTLPAMAAVWGLVERRLFLLYVAFALVGAVAVGYLYQLFG